MIAVWVQVLAIDSRPIKFIAQGKLVVGLQVNPNGSDVIKMHPQVFYDMQNEILNSGEIRRRALERLHGEHPELKEIEVEVRVYQAKGSSILKVEAVGSEPKYVRAFCDSLLAEFIAFRRELTYKAQESAPISKILEQVLIKEKATKDAAKALEAFQKTHDTTLLKLEHDRLSKLVSVLRGQIDEVRQRDPNGEKLDKARSILAEAEKQFAEIVEQETMLRRLENELEFARGAYDYWRKELDRLDPSQFEDHWDIVAIMERPSAAQEIEQEYLVPCLEAGAVGALVGFGLMFLQRLFFRSSAGASTATP